MSSTFSFKMMMLLIYWRGVPLISTNKKIIFIDFYLSMGLAINIDKTKVLIIKSLRVTYINFVYDKNNLEEVIS